MRKYTAIFAGAAILALAVPKEPVSTAGSWQLDARHFYAQLSSDGLTTFGQTNTMNITVGFSRVTGKVKLDDDDPTKSSFDFAFSPATATAPSIDEHGEFLSQWLADSANHTLVSFHSKGVLRTADGRLQTTGNLTLTRLDRNVEPTDNEAYAGPVYGPPMTQRVSRQTTFVFDLPGAAGNDPKDGGIRGSTSVIREDFPQLSRAVVGTYWPPVGQAENCRASAVGGSAGAQSTGTFLETPTLPEAPRSGVGEDYPGPQGFTPVVGEHLSILVHLRLTPKSTGEQAATGSRPTSTATLR